MKFKENHFLHFVLMLVFIVVVASLFFCYYRHLIVITRNTNRMISAKLIINALENYKVNNYIYPEKLNEIEQFLSPIPVDPKTQIQFEYKRTNKGYIISIPQEQKETIKIEKY